MLAGPNPGPLPILTLDTDTHTALHQAAVAGGGWLAGNTPIRRLDVPATNLHGGWRGPGGPATRPGGLPRAGPPPTPAATLLPACQPSGSAPGWPATTAPRTPRTGSRPPP